uniref:Integrase catalytic domain-containing protein n=1 Tax=Oryza brachyantha TaxID=4533 RepID=J3MK01_ORYBR
MGTPWLPTRGDLPFDSWRAKLELRHIPKWENTLVVELSRLAMCEPQPGTFEERLAHPSMRTNPLLREPEAVARTSETTQAPKIWGLNIVGPFKKAHGATGTSRSPSTFTKCPEAYPVVKIDKHLALKFIRGIIACFGVPNRINMDNLP